MKRQRGKITEVVSQAQSHLLGMAVRDAVTLPNVSADEAASLLTGLDVKDLPEHSGNTPFSTAGAQPTEPSPQPSSTLADLARGAAIAGGILGATRQPAPAPPPASKRQPTPPPRDTSAGIFTPPTTHHPHRKRSRR